MGERRKPAEKKREKTHRLDTASEAERETQARASAANGPGKAGLIEARDGETDEQEPEAEALLAEVVQEDDPAVATPPLLPASIAERGPRVPLARYDPLHSYMRDVQRYQLLSAEEERQTAIHYQETGDLEAAAKLVTANLRLVVKIAFDYRNAYKNIMDVVQEGNIGLMQAVKKFDPYKGVKLSTYAAWWIRAYILRFILNNARLVKLGTTQAQRKLFFNLKKEKARLRAMGIEPTAEAIAGSLQVTSEEVVEMDRRLAAGDLSLDAPVSKSDQAAHSRVETMPARTRRVDDLLADEELGAIFHEKLDSFTTTLTGKDKQIFEERLIADDPKTLQELGDRFGVSRERVRQLEKRLQQKLKRYLTDELGEGVFEG